MVTLLVPKYGYFMPILILGYQETFVPKYGYFIPKLILGYQETKIIK
jgi:hypothetical protein